MRIIFCGARVRFWPAWYTPVQSDDFRSQG